MKLVISGYYGFHNVGDEAILLSIIQALRNNQPDIELTVLSNDPAYTKDTYGVQAVNRWDLKAVWKVLQESDGLISGGGSLLQDKTSMKTIPYYTGIIQMAKLLRKRVFIYAQGMGPINNFVSKKIVRGALKNTYVTVRDVKSKQLLEDIGMTSSIEIVPDPVLGLTRNGDNVPFVEGWNANDKTLIVSVRDWETSIPFKKEIGRALDMVASDGTQILFLPMHGKHDEETSIEMVGMMNKPAFIAPHDLSIEEKINLIGASDVLLGMRLHALIFAAVVDTPFVAVSYDPKIDAFVEISGQTIGGDVDKNDWTGESLAEIVKQKLLSVENEKMKLRDKVRPEIEKAQLTAVKALEYFEK
jgi:polysaccharide pyruvyl transferase CsaB